MSRICIEDNNPFRITTPEDLSAQDAVDLFVDVFTDFPEIINPGHAFLMGPRGVGKSMMFRYLESDCQRIAKNCSFSELPFLGIYIPFKKAGFVMEAEMKRLENRHGGEIFNEHLMVSHISDVIFDNLLKNSSAIESINADSLMIFYNEIFLPLLYPYNLGTTILFDGEYQCQEILKNIKSLMCNAYKTGKRYVQDLSFTTELPAYNGPLFDYPDFLVPLLSGLTDVEGFPGGTIYLLIDDAHVLSDTQTHILNSWIATRTSKRISLKVSSEYSYKSYYTITGATIDTPHDYSDIDMTTVYTSSRGNYRERIRHIINRRLKLAEIDTEAEDFFPYDVEQEAAIEEIAEEYKAKYDAGEGRGHYRSDDAYRYARPDFIKSLAGSKKSSSKYSYSGFNQLVHLSSGIVRHFLEPAIEMYSDELANNDALIISSISPTVQNDVSRNYAERFLFTELEKYKKEGHENAVPKEKLECLSNLIDGLGGLFRQILLSDRSERKVFSIAISGDLSDEVEEILNIGVNYGYFHRSTIGRKDRKSGGRTRLYVMNRRLAPIWNLDPTGFAGYLFVKNALLEEGIRNPHRMLRRIEHDESLLDMDDQFTLSEFYDEVQLTNSIERDGEEDGRND